MTSRFYIWHPSRATYKKELFHSAFLWSCYLYHYQKIEKQKRIYNHEHSFKVLWISWIPKRHKNICLNKNLCSNIHSSLILNRMDTEQMSSKGWTDKQMWCFQTTIHYLTIKWNEVLIYDTIWMNSDNIMLWEKIRIWLYAVQILIVKIREKYLGGSNMGWECNFKICQSILFFFLNFSFIRV